jgi:hypothetical protein
MINALARFVIGAIGLGFALVGVVAMVEPLRVAGELGLTASAPVGAGSLRGDIAGFFLTGGLFALAAAVRNRRALLAAPLLLVGSALVGRIVTAVVDTPLDPVATRFIVIEAVAVAVLLLAGRALGRR